MGKTCIRCGYQRQPSDTAPETECPACGVIYARVEVSQATSSQAAQLQLAQALRNRRQHSREGMGAFFTFGRMVTPSIVTVLHIFILIGTGIGIVYSALDGNAAMAAAYAVALVTARIGLELTMVVFRISDDLGAVRELLADQAVAQARQSARSR